MHNILTIILAATTFWACASPCNSMDRGLTNEYKIALASTIAKQMHASSVDILQLFRFGTWSIIYVDTHVADEAYLFYAYDPLTSHYITLWGGGATTNEEQEIKAWTIKNVPGIPLQLASCFAQYVAR